MIVTRKIINPNIELHSFEIGQYVKSYDYSDICQRINLWKAFLVETYNVQPGQTVFLDFAKVYIDYIAAFFACAELGLILIDRMPAQVDIDYYVDFRERTELTEQEEVVAKNIVLQDYWFDYRPKNKDLLISLKDTVFATDTSKLTTSLDHTTAFEQSKRFINLLAFESGDSGLIVQNIHHHTYSMCYHFLPVLMNCNGVYTWSSADNLGGPGQELQYIGDFINENKINHVPVSVYPTSIVTDFLTALGVANHSIKIKTLNLITRKVAELVKSKNIAGVYSVFVSADSTVGYFVKSISPDTDMSNFSITGYNQPTDDFYQFDVEDYNLYVACPKLGVARTATGDKFIVTQSGSYQYSGQSTV